MRKSMLAVFALSSLIALAPNSRADDAKATPEAKDQPTVMCERGKQLVSEDFSGSTVPADWKVAKGKWEVSNGVLKGTEVASDMHAAVVRRDLKTRDMILQFSFRFDGGKQTALSVNKDNGHCCRAIVTPTMFSILRDPLKKGEDKPARLGQTAVNLAPGEWHTMVVEIHGKDMVASIDGQHTLYGSDVNIDVEKANFGFPVSGDSAGFAHVRVWEAGATKSDWETTKATLGPKVKPKGSTSAN